MPCTACNAPDGSQCNRNDCPANALGVFPSNPQSSAMVIPTARLGSARFRSAVPGTIVPLGAQDPQAEDQLCNHCHGDVGTSSLKCTLCRGLVCAACEAHPNAQCPRRKRLHQDLWIPHAERREVRSAFAIPVHCPECGSVQSPRDLRPNQSGRWGCNYCLDREEYAHWRQWDAQEITREQVCGTWNIEKYGKKTVVQKKAAVLDGLVAMLRAETPDWIVLQEVTNGALFVADLRQRLHDANLPYRCSGHELTLGEGSAKDHYILVYHIDKISIVLGPYHVGANERPESKRQVPMWRDRDERVSGKVLPHRGSVVWLTSSLPYQGPSSLTWVMGVHTSPTGSTNMIPAQIHRRTRVRSKILTGNMLVDDPTDTERAQLDEMPSLKRTRSVSSNAHSQRPPPSGRTDD